MRPPDESRSENSCPSAARPAEWRRRSPGFRPTSATRRRSSARGRSRSTRTASDVAHWIAKSQIVQFRSRRSSRAAIAPPIAMPARTVASIVVNAYVVASRNCTRMRNQRISSASAARPEIATTSSSCHGARIRGSRGLRARTSGRRSRRRHLAHAFVHVAREQAASTPTATLTARRAETIVDADPADEVKTRRAPRR